MLFAWATATKKRLYLQKYEKEQQKKYNKKVQKEANSDLCAQ